MSANDCIDCGRSTHFGSRLFVNRIPADTEEGKEGYRCVDCQCVECDSCNKTIFEYEIINGYYSCMDCLSTD